LQAQQQLAQLRQPDAAKAWLCRIARNLCVDQLRRQKWRRLLTGQEVERSHEETPEAVLLANEQVRQVKAAIEKLPAKLREVFVLNTYGELPYAEIAQVLGIKMGTVMSRLSRARTRIKQDLERAQ
jgi:RNA polymerase sigma-70 factor (ECF subfamily)